MRTPSITTLAQVFENPREAKRILQMDHRQLALEPSAVARARECYNFPGWVDIRLRCLNSIDPGLYGVESLRRGNEYAVYLNAGDCYVPTLIYWRGNYRVQCVADFVTIVGGFE